MLIRQLTPDDEPFLWDALYPAIHIPPGHAPPSKTIVQQPELARYVDGWMRSPHNLGVAVEVNNQEAGAAWLRYWKEIDKGYGYVNDETPELSMALLPGYRGQGLGTKLLHGLLSLAESRFDAVSLSVSETNPARRLYVREGFETCGDPIEGAVTMIHKFKYSTSAGP